MPTNIDLYFSGPIPPGFDADSNIQLAKQYAATHTPNEVVDWFNHMVRNNSDQHLPQSVSWDFKQIDSKYADFGNFWYGFAGKIIGISDTALKLGAGVAQGKANGLSDAAALLRALTSTDYGDNPGDQNQVQLGIQSAALAGVAVRDQITSLTVAIAKLSGDVQPFQGTPPIPVYGATASMDGIPSPIFEYVDSQTVRVLAGGTLYKIAEHESKGGNSISAEDLRIFNSILDPTKLGISATVLVPIRVGESLRMQFGDVAYALNRTTGEFEFSTLDAQGHTVRWQRAVGNNGEFLDRYVVTSAGDGSVIQETTTSVADVYGVNFATPNPTNLVTPTTNTTGATDLAP